jgi:phosphoribosylformylglycinamidine cyclo-ligase
MPFGFSEVPGTRGESAYVFDMGNMYGALVQEGLGTKSLIAQTIYKESGQSLFAASAQDTVATIINDLISVGATPVALNAYWSAGSYDWLADKKLTTDFITGWRKACDASGVAWGGGETQSLPGVVADGALELAGCAFGVIKDRVHLIQDKNLALGDVIVLVESSGVHANGVSLAREIAAQHTDSYRAKLVDGSEFGEALLTPTILYADLLKRLRAAGVNPHYVANITGHGWRKLMRANQKFSYVIEDIPTPQPVFAFIQSESRNSLEEMYSNYNMGAGYALYLPAKEAAKAVTIAKQAGLKAWCAGQVEAGPKQVVIKPLDIVFAEKSLEVR